MLERLKRVERRRGRGEEKNENPHFDKKARSVAPDSVRGARHQMQ
jgi:hypothetical protein